MTNQTAQNIEDQILAQAQNKIASTQSKLDEITNDISNEYSILPEEIPMPGQAFKPPQQTAQQTQPQSTPQSNTDFNEILSKISELEKELKNAQKLEQQIGPLKSQLTYMQDENSKLEEQLKEKNETVTKLSEQIELYASMQDSVFKMRYQLKQTQEEAERLRNRSLKSDKQLESTKENFKHLNQSLDQAQEQSLKLQKELEKSEQDLEKIKGDVETKLNPELNKYKNRVKEQETKISLVDSLTNSIDNLHQSVEDMRDKNSSLINESQLQRDTVSEERMRSRKMRNEYQEIYAELVTLSVEYMREGAQLPIIDQTINEKLQTWSMEHLLEEAKSGKVTRKEFTTILRSFKSENDLRNVLKNLGSTTLQAPKNKEYSIDEILNYDPKKSEQIPIDKLGLFKYLY